MGATTGTTTINNNLALGTGASLTTTGNVSFTPNGSNNVVVNTGASNFLTLNGLTSNSGTALCINGSNEVITCNAASQSLQTAYNNGNTITTATGKNIAFTLASGLASPTSFTLQNNGTNDAFDLTQGFTSGTSINGLLVNMNGAGGSTTNGIQISDTAGTLTNGITLSGGIANGINFSGTAFTNLINATNFTVDNSGDITNGGSIASTGNITTSGNLAVTADLLPLLMEPLTFLIPPHYLNIGGAATTLALGAGTGTATVNNATLLFPNAQVGIGISPISASSSITSAYPGSTGKAAAIINQAENQDILTASFPVPLNLLSLIMEISQPMAICC